MVAVLDGAHWDDLPGELGRSGLFARSLFLGAGAATEAAGPWLLPLTQREDAAGTVLALASDKPAAVFWGGAGEEVLWRHLRTLNLARLPAWAAAGNSGPEQGPAGIETVTFRHWDPRVLADVLPVLSEAQFTRVLGPAEEIVLLDPEHRGGLGVRRARALPDAPVTPRGMLSLDSGQMEAIGDAVAERSRRRIAAYLRDVAPDEAGRLGEAGTTQLVRNAEADGRSLGLRGEQGLGRWAYLSLVGEGRVARSPEVRAYVSTPGADPDMQVRGVMQALLVAAVETEGR